MSLKSPNLLFLMQHLKFNTIRENYSIITPGLFGGLGSTSIIGNRKRDIGIICYHRSNSLSIFSGLPSNASELILLSGINDVQQVQEALKTMHSL